MTIRWHLAALLKERDMTAYQLAKAIGVTNSAAYKLARATTAPRLEVSTLEAICAALDCQPGELLEYRKR